MSTLRTNPSHTAFCRTDARRLAARGSLGFGSATRVTNGPTLLDRLIGALCPPLALSRFVHD